MELVLPIAFAGGTADRAGARRRDEAWLAEARTAETTRVIGVRAASKLFVCDGPGLGHCTELPDEVDLTFLGVDGEGRAIFAADLGGDEAETEQTFEELRALAAVLPGHEAALAAHAVAMVGWHRRHRFCGCCGAPTEVQEAGHSRRCGSCGTQHFPRTDPAVIMLVTDGTRCVLGKRPGLGRWTVLAGFVEPGETLEQAVAREVCEEVGLKVTRARYLGSQPWPFPANLMLGFEAIVEPGEIICDDELEDAAWFTRDELHERLYGKGLDIPPPVSIANHLIHAWLEEGRQTTAQE